MNLNHIKRAYWLLRSAVRDFELILAFARAKHRRYIFSLAMKKLLRNPRCPIAECGGLFANLTYGWGNEDWSASEEFLLACTEHAERASGPILECGAGLSTILLGVVAQERGNVVWSLENEPEWAERVTRTLKRYGISSVRLCVKPLRDYGDFSWYDPPLDAMPSAFSMVICDGPPGNTNGGRYGLLSVMEYRLKPSARILLDDAAREGEKDMAARWATEFNVSVERLGCLKPFFLIAVPRNCSGDWVWQRWGAGDEQPDSRH